MQLAELLQPGVAIRDNGTSNFVGRLDVLKKSITHLQFSGSALAIIGERGVGKTSTAWQLMKELSFDQRLQTEGTLKLPYDPKEIFCLWFECLRDHHSIDGLILDILTRDETVFGKEYDLNIAVQDALAKKNTNEKIRKIIGGEALDEITGPDSSDERRSRISQIVSQQSQEIANVRILFREVLEVIRSAIAPKSLALFFDEIDRIEDKSGFGDLIKSGVSHHFVIIGVLDDISEIVQDHESVFRKFSIEHLPRLSRDEVRSFLAGVNDRFRQVGYAIEFDAEFVDLCVQYSDGFPSLLQRIAKSAFEDALNIYEDGHVFSLGHDEFMDALTNAVDYESDAQGRKSRIRTSTNNTGKRLILSTLSKMTGYDTEGRIGKVTKTDLRASLERNLTYGKRERVYRYTANVSELDSAGILFETSKYVRFVDPEMRAVAALMFELDYGSETAS